MQNYLKPKEFSTDPNSPQASKDWMHWFRTFTFFLRSVEKTEHDKLELLINHVSPNVYEFISDAETYEDALAILQSIYIEPKN